MLSTIATILLGASIATTSVKAAPIYRRDVTLDPAATAQAQPRDNTATRAFTAAQIKTSGGQCLSIDPNSGDFRENLIPVTTAACNGSTSQQWDIITAGVHNNQPGFALVVSTLTNGCLNFDPRRAVGDQVNLFSCGGRADGGGTVTNSQLFTFTGAATIIPLVPENGNNTTCLVINNSGRLDETSCNAANPSAAELFTIGAGSPAASSSSSTFATVSSISAPPALTEIATITSSGANAAQVAAPSPTFTSTQLNPTAVAEAMQRDNTAVRAFSSVPIKSSAGQCLFIDPNAGDFRENLIPVGVTTCDGSDAQNFDIITSGVHNNVPGAALIVSSLTQGCLNFDPRRAAGNQVILFSCGGRADGSGSVTNSQLFNFNGDSTTVLAPQNGNNATCLIVNDSTGLLDQTSCDASNPSAAELFTFNSLAAAAPTTSTSAASSATISSISAAVTEAASTTASATSSAETTASPTFTFTSTQLNPTAVAEAQQRDDTASRAFSSVQVKTSDGQCLAIDPNAGDFRENLIPIAVTACDGSAGQKFDVITSGHHDNVAGTALIVSSLTQGCLNFDPRRAAGNQVLLFSCGGRADGGGTVTNSQLFTFTGGAGPLALEPTNVSGTCLFNNNGLLDQTQCDNATDQTFTFVA